MNFKTVLLISAVLLLQATSSRGLAQVSPLIGVWEKTSEKCGSGSILGGGDGMKWEVSQKGLMRRWQGEFVRKYGTELKTVTCDVATGPIVIQMNKESIAFFSQTVRHTISCPQLPLEITTAHVSRDVFQYQPKNDQLYTEEPDDYNVCPSFDDEGYGFLETVFSFYKRIN